MFPFLSFALTTEITTRLVLAASKHFHLLYVLPTIFLTSHWASANFSFAQGLRMTGPTISLPRGTVAHGSRCGECQKSNLVSSLSLVLKVLSMTANKCLGRGGTEVSYERK